MSDIDMNRLSTLAKKHTTKELSDIFNTSIGIIKRKLASLGIKAKRNHHELDPWEDSIRELYSDETISITFLAKTFEVDYWVMRNFIRKRRMTRTIHPAMKGIPKTSLNNLFSGISDINEKHQIIRNDKNHKVVISQQEYCELWEKANSIGQENPSG
jgi:hypothetical protein